MIRFMSSKTHMNILILAAFVMQLSSTNSSLIYGEEPRTPDVVVNTKHGRVRGQRHYLPSFARTVDVYYGIPFAKPPVDHLRFMPPQPPERWNYVYNATKLPTPCWQLNDSFFGDEFKGSNMWNPVSRPNEDCLYLNVYVPRPPPPTSSIGNRGNSRVQKMAVMVWIYGGGFYSGSSFLDVYDGKYLGTASNTIVVTINYRLGALGFFTLNDPLAPPNVGLYDQLMALEWIQHNIAQFGGDPENVTLFGESAGAVSVSLHLLSPLSHDKFQRAILQSGAANMPWAVLPMAEAYRRSTDLATVLNCTPENEIMVTVDCLKKLPARIFVEEQWIARGIMQFPFLPVIDGVFLPDFPDKLMERREFKKCPILIGSNADEATFFIIYELADLLNLTWKSMTQKEFQKSLSKMFYYYPQFPRSMPRDGIEAVSFQYTDWLDKDDVDKNIKALDMAVSDSQFICPLNSFAHAYSAAGQDVYAYYFTQRIEGHSWPEWMGVLHGDEILFTFSDALKWKLNYTHKEQELSRKMILYWSNFAKTGNPNLSPGLPSLDEWPQHSTTGREYLELNSKYLDISDKWRAVGRGPRTDKCAFWTEYLPKLLNTPNTVIPCQPVSDGHATFSGSRKTKQFSSFHFFLVCSSTLLRSLVVFTTSDSQ